MTVTCPCCKATNEAASCRRCKADLGLLHQCHMRRNWHLVSARRLAVDGRIAEALEQVRRAVTFQADQETAKLHAALTLLNGEFVQAWKQYDDGIGTSRNDDGNRAGGG